MRAFESPWLDGVSLPRALETLAIAFSESRTVVTVGLASSGVSKVSRVTGIGGSRSRNMFKRLESWEKVARGGPQIRGHERGAKKMS